MPRLLWKNITILGCCRTLTCKSKKPKFFSIWSSEEQIIQIPFKCGWYSRFLSSLLKVGVSPLAVQLYPAGVSLLPPFSPTATKQELVLIGWRPSFGTSEFCCSLASATLLLTPEHCMKVSKNKLWNKMHSKRFFFSYSTVVDIQICPDCLHLACFQMLASALDSLAATGTGLWSALQTCLPHLQAELHSRYVSEDSSPGVACHFIANN